MRVRLRVDSEGSSGTCVGGLKRNDGHVTKLLVPRGVASELMLEGQCNDNAMYAAVVGLKTADRREDCQCMMSRREAEGRELLLLLLPQAAT